MALKDYEDALKIDEKYIAPMKNLAGVCELMKNFNASLFYIKKIIEIEPTNFDALFKLITLERQICLWRRSEEKDWELGSRIISLSEITEGTAAPSPFNILNIKDDPEFHYRATQNYAKYRSKKKIKRTILEKRKISKINKIRVGYFSADFHTHATMHLIAKLFALHNKSNFDIFLFSFGPNLPDDPFQKKLKQQCFEYIDLNGISDVDAVRLARERFLDIAVDLKGFTTDCRPEIFARGVAPVHINYLGYPGSMACDFMDYILADEIVIPKLHEKFYSEKVLRMKATYQLNDDSRKISAKKFSRGEQGLPEKQFIFCNFNNSYKIGISEFSIWCDILNECKNSILWLLDTSEDAKVI